MTDVDRERQELLDGSTPRKGTNGLASYDQTMTMVALGVDVD